jgi:hypothetical protein
MKLLFIKKTKVVIALLILTVAGGASAQCGSVVKEAIKKLTVFTNTGQTNNVTLGKGNKAEMHLTFYKGLNYKLQFGSDVPLGQYTFRILDENKNELYKCDGISQADYYTFFSNSSQELIIEVSATDSTKKVCVAVVVGMQVPKTNSIRNL